MSIHIANRESAHSRTALYYICYATNNSADLERNVGGEAKNLPVNFEARFTMHGNWYANLPKSRLWITSIVESVNWVQRLISIKYSCPSLPLKIN